MELTNLDKFMFSVRPQHLANIYTQVGVEGGEPIFKKNVELRRTRPKQDPPFEGLLYCTKVSGFTKCGSVYAPNDGLYKYAGKPELFGFGVDASFRAWGDGIKVEKLNGKVVGSFVCDRIFELESKEFGIYHLLRDEKDVGGLRLDPCLTVGEMGEYGRGKNLFALHITHLKMFDVPRELSDYAIDGCARCRDKDTYHCKFYCLGQRRLTRPPQSWCRVVDSKPNLRALI